MSAQILPFRTRTQSGFVSAKKPIRLKAISKKFLVQSGPCLYEARLAVAQLNLLSFRIKPIKPRMGSVQVYSEDELNVLALRMEDFSSEEFSFAVLSAQEITPSFTGTYVLIHYERGQPRCWWVAVRVMT